MSGTWALVPLKRLDRAKRRLAPALPEEERGRLVLAMVADVLAALDGVPGIERILLVSSEPEAGSLLARGNFDVFYSAQSEGMNRELEQAAAYASSRGAQRVLIVHGDLPYLTAAAIRKFLAASPPDGMQAAACKWGTGTNILLTPVPLRVPLVFGRHSLRRFRQLAESAGLRLDVVQQPRLAGDIDDLADFERLCAPARGGPRPGSATRAFLGRYAQVQSPAPRCMNSE
jgi:2-phospho-L-lactate/phosphoenolpyruvate guanylyltransferase